MDAKTGQPSAAVIRNLLERPRSFAFIQAVRLLALANARAWGGADSFLRRGLRIRPDLSLAHPGTDIVSLVRRPPLDPDGEETGPQGPGSVGIGPDGTTQASPADAAGTGNAVGRSTGTADPNPVEESGTAAEGGEKADGAAAGTQRHADARERYSMTVTFLSLYGASSPLPTFYTEELIEEAREDRDDSRAFLDIFNQALYTLYYRAFNVYKLGQRTVEDGDGRLIRLQNALIGLGLDGLAKRAGADRRDRACVDLCTRHTRTAAGLARCLEAAVGVTRVRVEQCVFRRAPIPPAQRARLGRTRLGLHCLGTSVPDYEGAFRIHLHDLDAETLRRFLPASPDAARLARTVKAYLNVPLDWDLVLHTGDDAARPARLGSARLGRDAFLCEPKGSGPRAYRLHRGVVEGSDPNAAHRGAPGSGPDTDPGPKTGSGSRTPSGKESPAGGAAGNAAREASRAA